MSEDTSGNPGVACWPEADAAWWAVRKMQLKLHRWASEGTARRFDDLYNLVCDPAFLVHAFERVATNAGARTPGVDRVTVARIRSRVGVEVFLSDVRGQVKGPDVPPDAGTAGDDP
jgi:RNA-directed DNA polymerase